MFHNLDHSAIWTDPLFIQIVQLFRLFNCLDHFAIETVPLFRQSSASKITLFVNGYFFGLPLKTRLQGLIQGKELLVLRQGDNSILTPTLPLITQKVQPLPGALIRLCLKHLHILCSVSLNVYTHCLFRQSPIILVTRSWNSDAIQGNILLFLSNMQTTLRLNTT